MFIVLKRAWEVLDASKPEHHTPRPTIPIGRHEIERIANPYGHDVPWLVLKGTQLGMTENSWREWADPEWEDAQVIIQEE